MASGMPEELFKKRNPLVVCAFSLPRELNEKIEKVAGEYGIRMKSQVMRVVFDVGWKEFCKKRGMKP